MAKTKTKAELLVEIEELKAEIEKLKDYQTEYDNTAAGVKALYDSFVKAGFNEEQALYVLVNFFKKIQN